MAKAPSLSLASLTNVGKSVANRIDFVFEVVASANSNPSQALEAQKRLCDRPTEPTQYAAFFPAHAESNNVFAVFETSQISAPKTSGPKSIYLFIVGCVNYEYPSSTITHQTGFAYTVFPGKSYAEIHKLITVPMVGPPVTELSFELQEMHAK